MDELPAPCILGIVPDSATGASPSSPATQGRLFHSGRIVIVMVGLPARGPM